MSNRFFIGLLVAMAVVVGVFAFTKKDGSENGGSSSGQPTNHVKGEGTSGVILTEYGDFQCSACYQYEPVVKQLFEKYQSQITFQFRHFPIVSAHPNAFAGSRAAEAAGKQNKFWEMHDKLYETQDPTGKTGWVASSSPLTFFQDFAKELNLDINQFNTDFASQSVNDAINADINAGNQVPVSGTPTFLINGKKIDTPSSAEEFDKLISDAITAKSQ